jgi:sulfate-transporting ATPase
MTDFARFFLFGLDSGSVYAIMAIGIVLIYRGSGILNFAQGAIGFLGLAAFYETRPHLGSFGAVVFGLVFTAAFGVLMQLLVMRPLRHSSPIVRVIATLTILTAIQEGALILFGFNPQEILPFLPNAPVTLMNGVIVSQEKLITFGITVVLTLALGLIYRYTRFGIATTAAAEKEDVAAALGWSPNRLAIANWAAGCALAGFAGIVSGPITGLAAPDLALAVVPALAAALLGGFSSFVLTLVGGLLIGVIESETTFYVSAPGWSNAVPFIVIVLVLVVRGRSLPLRAHLADRLPRVDQGRLNWWVVGLFGTIAVVTILVLSGNWANAMITGGAFALIILSQIVITGYAGQLSLAQYTIAGIGAFASTRLAAVTHTTFLLSLLFGVVVTVLVGALFALPALRIRGVSLAVTTLGLAVVIVSVVLGNPNYTGGPVTGTVIPDPSVFGIDVLSTDYPKRYALTVLVFVAIGIFAVINLRRGASGRRLIAVRGNERAAASLGISVVGAKLYAFAVAAGLAALGGILLGFQYTNVNFGIFDVLTSIVTVLYAVVGGIGYAGGAVAGGTSVTGGPAESIISNFVTPGEWYLLIGSLLLLLVLILQPDGLAPRMAQDWRKYTKRLRFLHTEPPDWQLGTVEGGAAAGRVGEVKRAALEVKDVTVNFGGVVALDSVSLRVEPGQIVGLIGPNGAGKTTLIDTICGFNPGYRGTVKVNEEPIDGRGIVGRSRLGLTRSFQSLELFEEMSVADNIRAASDGGGVGVYARDLVAPRRPGLSPSAIVAVREFQLEDILNKMPPELPYARRRLVAIARSVAARPSILLLDEPAAGLDAESSRELGALIRRLAREWKMAVLLIEHDVEMVLGLCDHVEVLNFGRTIASGAPAEIRNDPAVIDAYLGGSDDEPDTGDRVYRAAAAGAAHADADAD